MAFQTREGGIMHLRRTQLRGFLLAVALCTAGSAAAQEVAPTTSALPSAPSSTSSATPIADEAERIARERWSDGLLDQVQSEGSTFRLNISAPEVAVRAPWIDDNPPLTRRPTGGSIYHEEMLRLTVPEEFRTSTLYTPGISVDPATIVNGIRGVWRDWQVRRIRAQIARELEDLEAVNAAVSKH
jgi:hypothetical protein